MESDTIITKTEHVGILFIYFFSDSFLVIFHYQTTGMMKDVHEIMYWFHFI